MPLQALECDFLISSLFSMRMPYTMQSALSYPLPPPSTLLGILANAIYRLKKIPPLDAVQAVHDKIAWQAAFPGGPIVAKSYTVKVANLIHASQGKGKPKSVAVRSDALSRQFCFSITLSCLYLSHDAQFLRLARDALLACPTTMGDSESACTIESADLYQPEIDHLGKGAQVSSIAYLPKDLISPNGTGGTIYWVRRPALLKPKKGKPPQPDQQLVPYLFPLLEERRIIKPAPVQGLLILPARKFSNRSGNPCVIPSDDWIMDQRADG